MLALASKINGSTHSKNASLNKQEYVIDTQLNVGLEFMWILAFPSQWKYIYPVSYVHLDLRNAYNGAKQKAELRSCEEIAVSCVAHASWVPPCE